MRRLITLAAAFGLAAASIIGGASVASARGGGWTYDPASPFDRYVCGATMHFEFPVDRQYYRIATLHGDTVFQENGAFVDVITNTENGRSVTVNNSGPVFFNFTDSTVSVQGVAVDMLSPADAARNALPELYLLSGHLRASFDTQGVVIKIDGTYRDLCAELT